MKLRKLFERAVRVKRELSHPYCAAVIVAAGTANRMLKRHLAPQTLEKLLTNELLSDEDRRNNTLLGWLRNRFAGKAESHEEK